MNRMAGVYLYDDGQEIDVPCRYVEPVPPSKYDKVRQLYSCNGRVVSSIWNNLGLKVRMHVYTHTQVKGIAGPNRGLIGTLINIDEGDGIVKLDADSALKIIGLDQLAKYVPRQH